MADILISSDLQPVVEVDIPRVGIAVGVVKRLDQTALSIEPDFLR